MCFLKDEPLATVTCSYKRYDTALQHTAPQLTTLQATSSNFVLQAAQFAVDAV